MSSVGFSKFFIKYVLIVHFFKYLLIVFIILIYLKNLIKMEKIGLHKAIV